MTIECDVTLELYRILSFNNWDENFQCHSLFFIQEIFVNIKILVTANDFILSLRQHFTFYHYYVVINESVVVFAGELVIVPEYERLTVDCSPLIDQAISSGIPNPTVNWFKEKYKLSKPVLTYGTN